MKIAIITYYYKNNNYGGNLQAYALVDFIKRHCQVDVEQLSYRHPQKMKRMLRGKISAIYHRYVKDVEEMKGIQHREKCIAKFNQNIPHTKKIYSLSNIETSILKYDMFISGSDQVWNPSWTDDAYLLNFVPKDKYKIAYSVSLGKTELKDGDIDRFKKSLHSYDAISVREEASVSLLSEITHQKIEWLLDPTLLLSRADWNQVCTPRKYGDKYVFTYFLGDSSEQRNLVQQFADNKQLKIINIPHVCGYINPSDVSFADVKEFDAAPQDFISLIKYAEYIFTDSFHASVFSIIYEKNFFVFQRAGEEAMGTRLYSLTKLFDLTERFCDTDERKTIEYIESLGKIDFSCNYTKFEIMKKNSRKFIIDNIAIAADITKCKRNS